MRIDPRLSCRVQELGYGIVGFEDMHAVVVGEDVSTTVRRHHRHFVDRDLE
jgi:hypothetical protein